MHELGIVMDIVRQMEVYMVENKLKKIEKIVLQVGALSGIVPAYLTNVYPLAIMNTELSDSKLEIEETPGIGLCKSCGFRYNLVENHNVCPLCGNPEFQIISGREFIIKELHAY